MTKEEIVRALRVCEALGCSSFRYRGSKEQFYVDALIRDAIDLLEAQAAEIEKLKAQVSRWIPVTECLPEVGLRVLVLDRRGNAMVRTLSQLAGEKEPSFRPDGLLPKRHITHWMPLPGVEV